MESFLNQYSNFFLSLFLSLSAAVLANHHDHDPDSLTLKPAEHSVVRYTNESLIVQCVSPSPDVKLHWKSPRGEVVREHKGRIHIEQTASGESRGSKELKQSTKRSKRCTRNTTTIPPVAQQTNTINCNSPHTHTYTNTDTDTHSHTDAENPSARTEDCNCAWLLFLQISFQQRRYPVIYLS